MGPEKRNLPRLGGKRKVWAGPAPTRPPDWVHSSQAAANAALAAPKASPGGSVAIALVEGIVGRKLNTFEFNLLKSRLVSVAKCADSSEHGSVMPMNWA